MPCAELRAICAITGVAAPPDLDDLKVGDPNNPPGLQSYMTRRAQAKAFYITRDKPGRAYETGGLGISAADPLFADFILDLEACLQQDFPPSPVDEEGHLTFPGIPDAWPRLRTVAGYDHNPKGVVLTDNSQVAKQRFDLGSAHRVTETRISPEDWEVFNWAAEAIIRDNGVLHPVPIKKETSVGPPWMTNEVVIKELMKSTFENHGARLGQLLAKKDYRTLYYEYGWSVLAMMGSRSQDDDVKETRRPDGSLALVPELRTVQDITGRWREADKSLPPTMYRHKERFCARRRSIVPMGQLHSLSLRPSARTSEACLSDGPYGGTFKNRGHDDTEAFVSGAEYVYDIDAKGFDNTMVFDAVLIFTEWMRKVYGPVIAASFFDSFTPSIVLQEDRLGLSGFRLHGSPFKGGGQSRGGLLSGVPWTSLFGKYYGIANLFIALRNWDFIGRAKDDFLALLRRDRGLKVRVHNSGDDNLVASRVRIPVECFRDGSPYLIFAASKSYLGGITIKNPTGSWTTLPDISSRVLRTFVPGRSADDPQRGWWANGEAYGKDSYARHPELPRLMALVNDRFTKHFGTSWSSYVSARVRLTSELTLDGTEVTDLSPEEQEFINNPDVIQWKYLPSSVREKLRAVHFKDWEPAEYGAAYAAFREAKEV